MDFLNWWLNDHWILACAFTSWLEFLWSFYYKNVPHMLLAMLPSVGWFIGRVCFEIGKQLK